MKIHLLTLALLTPALLSAQEANPFVKAAEEEAAAPIPEDVLAATLRFRVPRKLLPPASAPVDAEASGLLLAQAWKWVDEGKAVLEDSSFVTGGAGEKFAIESVSEICYPTEWEPSPAGSWPGPASIETRNTGFTQVWEPKPEGDGFSLQSAFDHVRYAGSRDYFPLVAATRQPGDMIAPLFEADRSTMDSRFSRGSWVLAARYDGSSPDEMSRLCFAKLDLRARKPVKGVKEAKVFRGQLEWIEVDHTSFAKWMAKTPASEAAGTARAEAGRMIQAGSGSAVTTGFFDCRPYGRGQVQSVKEMIYPVEFERPYTPAASALQVSEGQVKVADSTRPNYPVEGFGAAMNGTSYQTRNTGFMSEFELSPDSQGFIGVRLSTEFVKHVGDLVLRRIKVNDQWIPDATIPHFYDGKITTAFHLEPGLPLLVGVLAPPDAQGNPDPAKRHLVFLTLTAEK